VVDTPTGSSAPVADEIPQVAVVFLASADAEPFSTLYREFLPAMKALGVSVECVFVGEPWVDRGGDLQAIADPAVPIRVFISSQSVGATGLLRMALGECRSPRLVVLTADRRVEASVLPELVRTLDSADVVMARRVGRRDSWVNRLQERVFHYLIARLTSCRFDDLGSGVRAIRREVFDRIPLYGESYRFFPVLAQRDGYRVREIDAAAHTGDKRAKLHAPTVYLRRILDIFGLYFLVRFTEKPLRFFGLVGSMLAIAGAALMALLFIQRIGGQGIADRPLLLVGVLLLVLGVQVTALGLVGEIIVHTHASRTRRYRLARAADER
jgi:hypothetical protein